MTKCVFIVALLCLLGGLAFADEAAPPSTPPAAAPAPAEFPRVMPQYKAPQTVPCIVPALRVVEPRLAATLAIRLQLTEEEKAKVLNMLAKAGEELTPKIDAQRKASEEFAKTLTKDGVTPDELAAAAEKAMKAESDVLLWKTKTLFDVRAMLTPEQNKLLTELLRQYVSLWLPPDMRPMAAGIAPPPVAPPTAPTTTSTEAGNAK